MSAFFLFYKEASLSFTLPTSLGLLMWRRGRYIMVGNYVLIKKIIKMSDCLPVRWDPNIAFQIWCIILYISLLCLRVSHQHKQNNHSSWCCLPPPEATVHLQPHENDNKPQGLWPLWSISLGGEAEEDQAVPDSGMQKTGWAGEPGEPCSGKVWHGFWYVLRDL